MGYHGGWGGNGLPSKGQWWALGGTGQTEAVGVQPLTSTNAFRAQRNGAKVVVAARQRLGCHCRRCTKVGGEVGIVQKACRGACGMQIA